MYKFEINFKEVLGNMSKISNVDKKKEIIGVILILIALLHIILMQILQILIYITQMRFYWFL